MYVLGEALVEKERGQELVINLSFKIYRKYSEVFAYSVS